ncbi:hypothetical protein HM1_0180 [Heliomicrobium modesticaldum Ice1]|uniref:Uncharacterized protein n=1 Tax=Heliobacterium modesticaldum (strain ATCC 51547 / Ice1) TaxID=498761 RepID=B0TDT6_HELMI|nr:hypothetical protein HM1_0180 [Heliomicrobium modesticaldum Ice1]
MWEKLSFNPILDNGQPYAFYLKLRMTLSNIMHSSEKSSANNRFFFRPTGSTLQFVDQTGKWAT